MRAANIFTKFLYLDYSPELVYMLTRAMKKGVAIGNLISFTLFSAVMYSYIPTGLLLLWFAAQSLLLSIRIRLAQRLEFHTKHNDILKTRFLEYYILTLVLNAFLWGLTSWLTVVYAPELYTFFTLALLLTLAAGATLPLGSVYHAYFAYTATMLLMVISTFVYFGGELHSIIAFVMVLAMIILMLNGYAYYLKIKSMVKLSMQLKDFNAALEERVAREVAKNMEKDIQLIHQERLAQMGEMLSLIAHQWRQPLHIISTAATDMELRIQLGTIDYKGCQKNLETIVMLTQHLSSTIDDFRDFFKVTKKKEETSLEEVVAATLRIVKEYIENQKITIETDLHSSETFSSYPNELKQVLLNLLKNAEDILLERGVSEARIYIKTFSDREKLYLEVCDNAGGVPQEIEEEIFNAYFSSKHHKEGSGLGLYMSKIIVEEHCGGELTLSNKEEGACFRITLPK
jgi:signal transduction histidine kinase